MNMYVIMITVPRGATKGETTMITIVLNGKTKAKFEKFESNKAMDWITQQGLFIKEKVRMDGNVLWIVELLP